MAVDLSTEHVAGWGQDPAAIPTACELAADVDVEAAARAVAAAIVAESCPDEHDPSFQVALHRSVHANVGRIFDIFAGREWDPPAPAEALEFADVCAHLGISAAKIERCYRVGMTALWERWFDLVSASAAAGDVAFPGMIKAPTLAIHRYVDSVLEAVVARHEEVCEELRRTQRDRRRMLLERILDGSVDSVPDELERALAYSVADTHIAILLETERMSAPEHEIAELRRAADARASILLQHTPSSWIAWLARSSPYDANLLARLRRALEATPFTAAVGDPGAGLDGLRRTREQAFEAAGVQRLLGPAGGRCTWLRDVRLEALLLADEQRARSFVSAELGALAAEDHTAARLRETLLTWLDVASHVSAAAMLGVHENTVRNRIRCAEEMLGAPLLGRRTELQVALRLQRLLTQPEGRPLARAA